MGKSLANRIRGRVLLVLACTAPLAQAAPADDIKTLAEQGRANEAYELGRQHQAEFGKPQFDYWYGLAAIDAGQPGQGVLALERYLLANPGSVNARLELGRGYFLLGDYARAREMFADVKRLSPPPEVMVKIDGFLAAIRDKEAGYRTTIGGFVEAGAGRDSNVNGGLAQDTIVLPLFGSVQLTADGRERSDSYFGLAAGVHINQPLTPMLSVFGALNADNRAHRDAEQFDQRNLGGVAGVAVKQAQNQFRASISTGQLDVNEDRYRTVNALTVEWNRSLGEQRGFSLYAQGADLNYAGDNKVRDARLIAAGAGWRQGLQGPWQPFLSIGVNAGRENNDKSREDLSRRFIGGRAGVGFTITPRINAALSLALQESRYQAFDPFFGAKRKDRYTSIEAALGYRITQDLGARLEISRIDNNSNVVLFDYQRDLVALKLRYDFK